MYYFYTRTKPNGQVYVGCTSQPPKTRWKKKYLFDTSDTLDEVIFQCDCDKHDADIIETYFIMKYDAVRCGLNKNYGNAMNHWYILPSCYTGWGQYIEENYQKVLGRLQDWMNVKIFKKS